MESVSDRNTSSDSFVLSSPDASRERILRPTCAAYRGRPTDSIRNLPLSIHRDNADNIGQYSMFIFLGTEQHGLESHCTYVFDIGPFLSCFVTVLFLYIIEQFRVLLFQTTCLACGLAVIGKSFPSETECTRWWPSCVVYNHRFNLN